MKELLKECRGFISEVIKGHGYLTDTDIIARIDAVITAEENREPDAWARDLDGTGSLHMCAKHDEGAIPLYRSIAPPQVPGSASFGEQPNMQATIAGSASKATILPDGSAFATLSMPLPKDHWLYAPLCNKWDNERDTTADTPHPILDNSVRDKVIAAARYAIRGATMCGKSPDFDPDALALNFAYAVCGPANAPASKPADGAAQCPRCGSDHVGLFNTGFCSPDNHHTWHDSKPIDALAAPEVKPSPSHQGVADAAGGGDRLPPDIAQLRIDLWKDDAEFYAKSAKHWREKCDAALRELNELKSKLAQIPTAQYCTPHDK